MGRPAESTDTKPAIEKPKQIAAPDWSKVHEMVIADFEFRHTSEWHEDNDDQVYLYEAAMQAVYGPDVFKYLNGLRK